MAATGLANEGDILGAPFPLGVAAGYVADALAALAVDERVELEAAE